MQRSLLIRLALIVALLFAQLGGLTHGVAHAFEEHRQSSNQSLPDDHKQCDLCAEYAHIGSALTSTGIGNIGHANCETLHFSSATFCTHESFAAFAARAPPYSA